MLYLQTPPPTGTTFVPNSFTIGGISQPGESPIVGVNLGTIISGGTITVGFDVIVNSIPDPPVFNNVGRVDFIYRIDPAGPDEQGSSISNQVSTQALQTLLEVVKSVDKAFAEIGDILTYTITITNTGTVEATNVIFTDIPPDGTSFIPGSVTINGSPSGGDPSLEIPLPDIGGGGVVTVIFRVSAVSIPTPNPTENIANVQGNFVIDPVEPPITVDFDSNLAGTTIEEAVLDVIKIVDKAFAQIGDTLIYTITINNTGTVVAENVVFTDIPSNGISFVLGSLIVNGIPTVGNPSLGIPIPDISPMGSVTVTFEVTVDAIPVPNPTQNIAAIDARFPVDPQNPIDKTFDSNPADTKVEIAELEVVKSVNVDFAEVGETLTYTIMVINTGTVTVEDATVTDNPPNGTSFILESVKINGIPSALSDPQVGINVGNLISGGSVIVTFEVLIDAIPIPNLAVNIGVVEGLFLVEQDNPVSKTFDSNQVDTTIERATLSIIKSTDKAVAEVGEKNLYNYNN